MLPLPYLILKTSIHYEFNTSVCTSTIKNCLDRELLTVEKMLESWWIIWIIKYLNKLKKSDYMTELFQEISEERTIIIVWIDETNFNLYNKRREEKSRIGSRTSILLTANAVILFSARRGALKSGDCITWFEELIAACEQRKMDHNSLIDPTYYLRRSFSNTPMCTFWVLFLILFY